MGSEMCIRDSSRVPHTIDADLWEDALEALAAAMSKSDCARALEAAAAVAASTRFILRVPEERHDAVDRFVTTLSEDEYLAVRRAALETAQDMAVARRVDGDAHINRALYTCTARHLSARVLRPLGFPANKLGLRSLVAADRATGSQRAAAALTRAWHG